MTQISLLFVALLGMAGAMTPKSITLNNGVKMPTIAYGTWKYNDSYAQSGVVMAVEAGFKHIDTANDYWNQAGTGDGINEVVKKSGRSSLFVTSKVEGCGVAKPPHGTPVRKGHCYNDTLLRFDENLALLKLDSVDLMLVHWPPKEGCTSETCPWMQQQWSAFEEMYKAGKARAIGVSNYCISCLQCLEKTMQVTPTINQVLLIVAIQFFFLPSCSHIHQIQFHVGMGDDPTGLISYCAKKKIQVLASCPLACDEIDLSMCLRSRSRPTRLSTWTRATVLLSSS
jgi:diketogulonate reductase-like aldo/keto reductase